MWRNHLNCFIFFWQCCGRHFPRYCLLHASFNFCVCSLVQVTCALCRAQSMVGGSIPPDCSAIFALVIGFIGGRLYPGGSPAPDPSDEGQSNCSVDNSTPTVSNITLIAQSEEKCNLWFILFLLLVTALAWAAQPKKEVAVFKAKYIKLARV